MEKFIMMAVKELKSKFECGFISKLEFRAGIEGILLVAKHEGELAMKVKAEYAAGIGEKIIA